MEGGPMFESPRETHKNLLDGSMKECTYVTRGSLTRRKAGRRHHGKERREPEDGREEEVGCPEEEEERCEERQDTGEPIRRKAEHESWAASARNGESGKASHVHGGTNKVCQFKYT
ncbi:hypothetical protein NDU88_005581 [Pleurodeles waltl]|uniref:Uncharacterized protein n=1 Tax=Pleurodeles waltl TaxID=8319 RepID=A0AAV7UIM2_PLEWA|nr:hypothetical protein NDU88_005581 [Pleurodeles waltl]